MWLFSSFLTWGCHSHFVRVKYTTRGPIKKNIVSFNSPLHSSPYITSHPTCVFHLLANDTHIIGPTSDVILVFLWLQKKFSTLMLSVQPMKCVTWFPRGLDHFISLPPNFLTPNLGFCILGTPMGSRSFVESFMAKAFHEDLEMISNFLMLANLQVTFTMFSLCYAHCLGYLLHTMFPSPNILQRYVEFNICTITTLEKLFGAWSFGGFMNHLTHHQATIPASSNGFNFPSIVRTTTLAFLGCWALIAPTFVSHF